VIPSHFDGDALGQWQLYLGDKHEKCKLENNRRWYRRGVKHHSPSGELLFGHRPEDSV
jgi:hypothetical protein